MARLTLLALMTGTAINKGVCGSRTMELLHMLSGFFFQQGFIRNVKPLMQVSDHAQAQPTAPV